jgi:hypothetical protein
MDTQTIARQIVTMEKITKVWPNLPEVSNTLNEYFDAIEIINKKPKETKKLKKRHPSVRYQRILGILEEAKKSIVAREIKTRYIAKGYDKQKSEIDIRKSVQSMLAQLKRSGKIFQTKTGKYYIKRR